MKKFKDFIQKHWLFLYTIYFITIFVDSTTLFCRYPIVDPISQYTRIFIYILFGIRLIMMIPEYIELLKQKKSNLVIIMGVLVILLLISLMINFLVTRNRRLLSLSFILLSALNINYKDIVKREMQLQIILGSLTILFSSIGLLRNYSLSKGKVLRHSMGFTFPTNLTQIVLFGGLLYIYVNKDKITYVELFIIQILNALAYYITKTRADFFLLELIIIFTIMFKVFNHFNLQEYKEKIKKIYSFIITSFFPTLPVYLLLAVAKYTGGGILFKINAILSNRFSQSYYNLLVYGIHPFGSKVEFHGFGIREFLNESWVGGAYVDSEYLQMVFKEGYIAAFLFVLILTVFLIMLYRLKKYDDILMCSVYLLFGLVNPRIITLMYCPILFMVIPTVIEYNKVFTRRRLDEKI